LAVTPPVPLSLYKRGERTWERKETTNIDESREGREKEKRKDVHSFKLKYFLLEKKSENEF
jgi:hypothetical protein